MKTLLVLFLAFFLGAVPVTFILVKFFYGRDIRQVGSKTASAMNVVENLSFGLGILSAALDILKAALAMLLAKYWVGSNVVMFLAPVLIVAGDIWTPFLKFGRGKGLAAMVGILLIVKWPAAIYLALFFVATMFLLRESDLVTNIGLAALPFITWWQLGGVAGFAFGLVMLLPFAAKYIRVGKGLLPWGNANQRFRFF
ncbi:MAG: glycerol-3-phosphate acyltransferase [Bacillota bacterium]